MRFIYREREYMDAKRTKSKPDHLSVQLLVPRGFLTSRYANPTSRLSTTSAAIWKFALR